MVNAQLATDWTPRIGSDAVELLDRSLKHRRYGFILATCYMTAEIASQLAESRLGMVASFALLLPATFFWVIGGQNKYAAARAAGLRLGLTSDEVKYMPLRYTSTFDTWISKRNHPKFPRVTRYD